MRKDDHINYISACVLVGLCIISFVLMLYGSWLFLNDLATAKDVLISISLPLIAAALITFEMFLEKLPKRGVHRGN